MALLPPYNQEYSVETRETWPAHLLTTIDSFLMLSEHEIRTLELPEFEAGGYKWKLTINLDVDEHISVYLSLVETSSLAAGWEVNAIFNFFLYNHISNNYLCFRGKARRFLDIDSEWGFSKLLTMESLRRAYIFKDKCVVGAEVFVIKKKPLIQNVSVLKLSDPCKREWMISEFYTLEGVWESEELFAGGYKWNIRIYPNGNGKECGRYVSIFLNCVDAKSFGDGKKVYAACLFLLRNNLNDKKDHSMKVRYWFTSTAQSLGFDEFIAIDEMRDHSKGFLSVFGSTCTLEIQLSVLALQEEALQ